jgi:hypothetical protein
MNPALFGVVIIAAQFLVALALLFVAGSLIRIDLNRAEAGDSHFVKRPSRFIQDLRGLEDLVLLFVAGSPIRTDLNRAEAGDSHFVKRPSWFIQDLRGLGDALVEFFARSTESCLILSVLVAHRKPLRLATIAQEVQLETDRRREPDVLPMSIAWGVLPILQVSGLVRMSRHGFLATEVGREVHRRIEGNSAISAEDYATYHSTRTVRDQCGPDRGSSTGHVNVVPQKRKLRSSDPRERCIAAAPNA